MATSRLTALSSATSTRAAGEAGQGVAGLRRRPRAPVGERRAVAPGCAAGPPVAAAEGLDQHRVGQAAARCSSRGERVAVVGRGRRPGRCGRRTSASAAALARTPGPAVSPCSATRQPGARQVAAERRWRWSAVAARRRSSPAPATCGQSGAGSQRPGPGRRRRRSSPGPTSLVHVDARRPWPPPAACRWPGPGRCRRTCGWSTGRPG